MLTPIEKILFAIADGITAQRDSLANLIAQEAGKPIRAAKKLASESR